MIKMKSLYLSFTILFLLIGVCQISCRKFVEIPPPKTGLVDASVFNNEGSVRAALSGIYSDMQSGGGFASGSFTSLTFFGGLSTDELISYNAGLDIKALYQNTILPSNGTVAITVWTNPYHYIYICNSLITGINATLNIPAADKSALVAEAKFIRAFCYFYLTNLYGDVPLYLSADYSENIIATRATQAKVYDQITSDLLDAQKDMAKPGAGDFRVLPNNDAATALLARVYLYTGKYQQAIDQANSLIGNSARYTLLTDLNAVFLKNSKEAIWQMQPVIPGLNTNEGSFFILTAAPTYVSLAPMLVNAFESGDKRRQLWVDSIQASGATYYFPFKYKIQSGTDLKEYSMVFRLAEQYLIRAEAKTYLGDYTGARSDLNAVRTRAGLPESSAADKAGLLSSLEHERQVELFTEWGHRWLDLKRTGRATAVLGLIKPGWKATAVLYPIPAQEISANKNITQNPGY
ncbi:RagB/SusD family nutrient uptake outer membrane protein [Chitinophaga sp. CC14]|uniref:RagB/SusD family nutrient uptake outer membrane protein n=1 Tax=Chitinophaga sp. CC14 TaxID=3029199 RepID=UPI003B775FF7